VFGLSARDESEIDNHYQNHIRTTDSTFMNSPRGGLPQTEHDQGSIPHSE
jgi:hypothetical protein